MLRLLSAFALGLAAGIALMEAYRWRCEKAERAFVPWQTSTAGRTYGNVAQQYDYADCGER